MAVDPRNFILNTDYPLDKIVYMESGSFTATTSPLGDVDAVEHNLPFRPYVAGSWSLNSDFSTSNEFFRPTYADLNGIYVECLVNDTYVSIISLNQSGGDVTIYWRTYGFMPSGVGSTAAPTAALADSFQFNTDYNYCKLWYSDSFDAGTGTHTITHNFGYKPQVMAWWKNASASYGDRAVNNDSIVGVTDTTVTVDTSFWGVYLMVYADSQV